MRGADILADYLVNHFLPLDRLAARSGMDAGAVEAMISARAVPGAIYSVWPNGAYSSPIGGLHDGPPAGAPRHWYSPAAIWWLRRAVVTGLPPADAAMRLRTDFIADFVRNLGVWADGPLGYPGAYADGKLDPEAASGAGEAEWADWIGGGYGVCLRCWDAPSLVAKTVERARIIAITGEGRKPVLTPAERLALLSAMERLEAVMLPFAPHQRPHGTPGLWIDAMLVRYGLGGAEAEEAASFAPAQLCA